MSQSLGGCVGFSVGNVFSIFDAVDFEGDVFSTSYSPGDAGGGVDRVASFLSKLKIFCCRVSEGTQRKLSGQSHKFGAVEKKLECGVTKVIYKFRSL